MQVIRVSTHLIILINVFVCLSLCYMGYDVMSERCRKPVLETENSNVNADESE